MFTAFIFLLKEYNSDLVYLKRDYDNNTKKLKSELAQSISQVSGVLELIEHRLSNNSIKQVFQTKYHLMLRGEGLMKYGAFFYTINKDLKKNHKLKQIVISVDEDNGLQVQKILSSVVIVGIINNSYLNMLRDKYNLDFYSDDDSQVTKITLAEYNLAIPVKKFKYPQVSQLLLKKRFMILLLIFLCVLLIVSFNYIYWQLLFRAKEEQKADYNLLYEKLSDKITKNSDLKAQIKDYKNKLTLLEDSIASRLKFVNEVYPQPREVVELIRIAKKLKSDKHVEFLKQINTLFDLTELPNKVVPCNVEHIINQVKSILGFEAYKRDVSVKVTYMNNMIIHSDQLKLTLIIYGLLKRAVKRTPQQMGVSINVKVEQTKVEILIKDYGFNFFEGEIKKMLLNSDVCDNIALELAEIEVLSGSISGVVKESLGGDSNEIKLLLPIKLNKNLRSNQADVVQIFK